jgi:anion-transporting  ArsA/GET3 family ATPase
MSVPERESRAALSKLIDEKKVMLCVGCGGVGKTTTSASLALAAAMRGKRVLCLTIDPAKRLANSLGLREMTSDEQRIDDKLLAAGGVKISGTLTVMMLDTKKTFDEIVTRYASSQAARENILKNRLYQYVSTSLAGTQEYMAMEKLEALRARGDYDLIVLDTPPTANALDFLDAPERMIDAIDSPAMRWFVQAFNGDKSKGLSLGLLTKGSQLVLKAVAQFTGAAFLNDLAGFIAAMNDLFDGFTERARKVSLALRSPDVAFVMVTSPDPLAIDEINFFAERLKAFSMPSDVYVVNRVHTAPMPLSSAAAIEAQLGALGIDETPQILAGVLQAHRDADALATRDRLNLQLLDAHRASTRTPVVHVPAFDSDVHDVRALSAVAALLTTGADSVVAIDG